MVETNERAVAPAERAKPHAESWSVAARAPAPSSSGGAVSQAGAGVARDDRPSIIGRFFRFILSVMAFALLMGAAFGALNLAYDMPGVMAAGGFGREAMVDMRRAFDTSEWPPILRAFIALGMFLLAMGSATIILMLRRRGGGIHMLRAAAGIFLVLWAPFVLFSNVSVMRVESAEPNGWVVTQLYLKQIEPQMAIRAAVVVLAGVMLLIWPARRRAKQAKSDVPTPAAK